MAGMKRQESFMVKRLKRSFSSRRSNSCWLCKRKCMTRMVMCWKMVIMQRRVMLPNDSAILCKRGNMESNRLEITIRELPEEDYEEIVIPVVFHVLFLRQQRLLPMI